MRYLIIPMIIGEMILLKQELNGDKNESIVLSSGYGNEVSN